MLSVCFGLSGYFYYQVGRTLKTGRQNSRTRTLSLAFIALWSCWGICAVPNMVFYTWFRTSSNLNSFVESSKFITPSDFAKDMMTTGGFQILWYDKINQFIVYGDIAFRALRHSYSSINSLLLIILLRPFQRPMLQIMSKMLYICRRIFEPKKLIEKNWAKFVKSQFKGLGVKSQFKTNILPSLIVICGCYGNRRISRLGGLADNQKMRFQPYCKPVVTDQLTRVEKFFGFKHKKSSVFVAFTSPKPTKALTFFSSFWSVFVGILT